MHCVRRQIEPSWPCDRAVLKKNLSKNGWFAQKSEYPGIGRLYQRCHVHFAFNAIDEPDLESIAIQHLDLFYPPWHAWVYRRRYARG